MSKEKSLEIIDGERRKSPFQMTSPVINAKHNFYGDQLQSITYIA